MKAKNWMIFLIFLFFTSSNANSVICSITKLKPSLAPIGVKINVTIYVTFQSTEHIADITRAKFIGTYIDLTLGICEQASHTGQKVVNFSIDPLTPSVCQFNAQFNSSSQAVVSLLTVDNCDGQLPFQSYKFSEFDFSLSPVSVSRYGGNYLTLQYTLNAFIQTTEQTIIRVNNGNGTSSVEYDAWLVDQYTASIASNVADPSKHSIMALLDDQIKDFKTLFVYVALDGRNFEPIGIPLEINGNPNPLNVLVMLSGHFDLADNVQKQDMYRSFQKYTSSMKATTEENLIISSKDYEKFKTIISTSKYDVIFLLSVDSLDSESTDKYCQLTLEMNPQAQLVVTGAPVAAPIVNSHLNYIWAHIYQAEYLTGFIVGRMFKDKKNARLCYCSYDNSFYSSLEVNSFKYGLVKGGYDGTLLLYTLLGRNVKYESQWIAANIFVTKCDLVATNVDNYELLQVLHKHKIYIIGTQMETRTNISLGDYVLTAAAFNWSQLYTLAFDKAFNKSLGGLTAYAGYESGAVYLAEFSPFIEQDVRDAFDIEETQMNIIGAMNHIFKGPVYDNQVPPTMRIAPNQTPNVQELYSMNWTISGVELDYTVLKPPNYDDKSLPVSIVNATYVLVSLFDVVVVVLMCWVYFNRSHEVIENAQPLFLYMVLLGSAVGMSTVIPLSQQIKITADDAYRLGKVGIEALRDFSVDSACGSLPWLLTTGYGLTIPVLILKTWRQHKILGRHKLDGGANRVTKLDHLSVKDVCLTIMKFLGIPYLLLMSWALTEPMKYVVAVTDNDDFQNPIQSYGYCALTKSGQGLFFGIVFLVVIIIVIGNFVCFISRNDESANNEVTFIFLSMINFLQVAFIGCLICVILVERPLPRYVVSASTVVFSFGGLVVLIFVPKIVAIIFEDKEATKYTITQGANGTVRIAQKYNTSTGAVTAGAEVGGGGPTTTGVVQYFRAQKKVSSAVVETLASSSAELSSEEIPDVINPMLAEVALPETQENIRGDVAFVQT